MTNLVERRANKYYGLGIKIRLEVSITQRYAVFQTSSNHSKIQVQNKPKRTLSELLLDATVFQNDGTSANT